MKLDVHPDIARATTLDPRFYADPQAYTTARERIFARSWQWLGDTADVARPASLSPRTLLASLLDEPLLLARDEAGTLRCLSNVCTHRANVLVPAPCHAPQIRCGYHSRRFDLAGRMTFMPEMAGAECFPSPADDLPQVALAEWQGHAFASLDPVLSFDALTADLAARLRGLDFGRYLHAPERDRDYTVQAHWALYVENYLEGLHIPFVHTELAQVVDIATYDTELFRHSSLQTAGARPGQPTFAAPLPGDGAQVPMAAYYAWIFPNLMLNFYPWGLSVNLVEPTGPASTRVRFRTYVGDATKLDMGAGQALDRVEMEDEAIVLAVQRGVRSRLYRGGRYSPTQERAVHHFHRLLAQALND
jgi:choline monooxygenase